MSHEPGIVQDMTPLRAKLESERIQGHPEVLQEVRSVQQRARRTRSSREKEPRPASGTPGKAKGS